MAPFLWQACMDVIKWCHPGHVFCFFFLVFFFQITVTSRARTDVLSTGVFCFGFFCFNTNMKKRELHLSLAHMQHLYCCIRGPGEKVLALACPLVVKKKGIILSFGIMSRKHFKKDHSLRATHKKNPLFFPPWACCPIASPFCFPNLRYLYDK